MVLRPFLNVPSSDGRSLEGEVAYRVRQHEVLAELGILALRLADPDALLQEASRLCAEGLRVEMCKVLEPLPGNERLLVRAGVGWAAGVVGTATLGADLASPAGYALRTGEGVISNHLGQESRFRTPELLAQHGVKRAINVPIHGEAGIIGVLEADTPQEGRFDAADAAFLAGVASLIGVALERLRAQEAREAQRRQLRAVLDQLPVGVAIAAAPSGELLHHNEAAIGLLRHPLRPSSSIAGYAQYGALHPDGAPYEPCEYPIARALSGDVVQEEEMIYRRGDGSLTCLAVSAAPVQEEGVLTLAVATFRDIAEEKRTRARLRESEEQHRLIVEGARDYAIFTTDRVGRITSWPPGAVATFGWTPQEVLGQEAAILFTPEDREAGEPERELREARERGVAVDSRWHQRRDGSRIVIEGTVRAMHDASGALRGFLKIGRDVTERRRVEEALRGSEESFRTLANSIPQLAWMADRTGSVYWYNQRWYDYTGTTPEEMEGWGWREVVHPAHAERVMTRLEHSWETGEPWEDTFPLRDRNGGHRWFLSRALPIRDPEGRILRWFGTNTDITESRALEEQQRLLMHELNHRVKNTLATVQAIARQTLRGARSMEEFSHTFEARLGAVASTHNLLVASHWHGADLRDVIQDEIAPYRGASGESRVRLDGPVAEIPAGLVLITGLVFHELATNAAKYGALSVPGGRVDISWRMEETPQGPMLHLVWVESGGPPVTPPQRRGFGSRLIERGPAQERGRVRLDFDPAGLRCTMDLPLGGPRAGESQDPAKPG